MLENQRGLEELYALLAMKSMEIVGIKKHKGDNKKKLCNKKCIKHEK